MVQNILKKSIKAFTSKQTNIFSAAFFIIITTVLSQVLGLLKYRLLVSIFGASSDVGVFFASFRIPDFLFQILIGGALSTVFIPVFSDYIAKDKKEEGYFFTSSLINISIVIFATVSILISIFSYNLSSVIAPGFSNEELILMSNLIRIILISQLFFVLGTLITAILQSFQHFLIPGIAAAFYNLGIIIGLIVLTPFFGIFGAAWGVLLGSILFCLVQLPLLKEINFKFHFTFNIKNGVAKVFNLMVPRSLTIFASQIAITANVFFASFISARSLVIFDLAQSIFMAPVILFGQSIAQASFPSLSLKNENKNEFIYILISSFNQILYLTLPITALLIVLRIPIVRLFFGASKFDWEATVNTGMTLAFFSISIVAASLIYLLSRAFYALRDTKTPFVITVFSIIINIFLSYVFIFFIKDFVKIPPFSYPVSKINLLALSYSIASAINAILLFILLNKKIGLPKIEIFISFIKIFIATFIVGVSLYIPIKLLDQLVIDTTKTINLMLLTGIASFAGFMTYLFFTWLFNIKEAYYVIAVFKKFGDWNKILKQVDELIYGEKINP